MVSVGGREGGPHALLGRVQTDAVVEDNGEEVPQGTRNISFIWQSGSTSGYVSEGNRNTIPRGCLHPHLQMILVNHKGIYESFLGGTSGKESACQCRRLQRHGFYS